MKVALFVTCLTDTFFPQVGVSVVRTLRRLGCDVDFPPEQTCCGQPMLNTGYPTEARRVLLRWADVFDAAERVVCPSGSCASLVKVHGQHLFHDDEPALQARMGRVADKTHEFTQFLQDVLRVDLAAWGLRVPNPVSPGRPPHVTHHFACHMRGLGGTPTGLTPTLQALGCAVTPLPTAEQCCGFGGTFAEKFGEISEQMTLAKVRELADTGAQTLVCNEAGCAMCIGGMLSRRWAELDPHRPPPRLAHLAELLDEAMTAAEAAGPVPWRSLA